MPERRYGGVKIKRTAKLIGAGFAAGFISLAAALTAGGIGFSLSFLAFGDGSELYFRLQKTVPVEPYLILPVVLFTAVFVAALLAAAPVIKKIVH